MTKVVKKKAPRNPETVPFREQSFVPVDLFDVQPSLAPSESARTAQDRVRKSARTLTKIAANRTCTLEFYQQLTVAWPSTTPILHRLATTIGEAIDPTGQRKTLLDNIMGRMPAALNWAASGERRPIATTQFFSDFCINLVREAQQVQHVLAVSAMPPNAKHRTDQPMGESLWKWWAKDFLIWRYTLTFGANQDVALTPQLPTPRETGYQPHRPVPKDLLDKLDAIGEASGLEPWATRLLFPRLLDDHDIRLIAEAGLPDNDSLRFL